MPAKKILVRPANELLIGAGEMYLKVQESTGMLRVLSAMVGQQKTYLNCRRFTLAKIAIFQPRWVDGVYD